jgi:hypothetical protein
MKVSIQKFIAALCVGGLNLATAHAQHGHIYAGVYDTDNSSTANAGDKLGFKNGSDYAYDFVGSSGYVKNDAVTAIAGTEATFYGGPVQLWNWTPLALSGNSGRRYSSTANTYAAWESFAPNANGAAAVGGAASGAWLNLEMVSVELLSGSATQFSFWDSGATTPTGMFTFSGLGLGTVSGRVTMNMTAATTIIGNGLNAMTGANLGSSTPAPTFVPSYPNAFSAADQALGFRFNDANDSGPTGDHSEAVDPYGHIHGRRWVANGDGEFKVTLRVVDANNLHLPSDALVMKWASIPEPAVAVSAFAGLAALAGVVRSRRRA